MSEHGRTERYVEQFLERMRLEALATYEDAELVAALRERIESADTDADELSRLGIMLLNLASDAAETMIERDVRAPIETSDPDAVRETIEHTIEFRPYTEEEGDI